jgi:hypothetical protein
MVNSVSPAPIGHGPICGWYGTMPDQARLRLKAAQGKFVTFGVTRGCIAVAAPVSSITWLIPP